MARKERFLVGLDVGTSKISAIVGEIHLRSPSSFSHLPAIISGAAPTAVVADGMSPLA